MAHFLYTENNKLDILEFIFIDVLEHESVWLFTL